MGLTFHLLLATTSFVPLCFQLKALFDRPVGFKRDTVGGMGTGMCCLAARVKALGPGAECGARRRTDEEDGTDVWFRLPFDPPPDTGSHHSAEQTALFLNVGSGRHLAPASGVVEVFAPEDFNGPPVGAPPAVDDAAAVAAALAPAAADASRPARRGGAAPAAAVPPRSDDMSSMPDAKPLAGLRILVVDDSAPIRKVMQRTLTGAGAAVETAIDGKEAVDMVTASVQAGAGAARYDIIVTDIQVGG